MRKWTLIYFMILIINVINGQDTIENGLPSTNKSTNVFTSGLFLSKGKIEFKTFNNLYTETNPSNGYSTRGSFFTSFIQLTIGTSRNVNFGIDALYKSNISNDVSSNSPFSVLNFERKTTTQIANGDTLTTQSDHGLSHVGGRVRTNLFNDARFTFQQGIYFPTAIIDKGVIFTYDLYYQKIIANKLLFFADLGVFYNITQKPFPYLKLFTGTFIAKRVAPYVLVNLPYEVGAGTKIFLTPKIELEFLYSYWLPFSFIVDNRKPVTFNVGLRLTNFKNF